MDDVKGKIAKLLAIANDGRGNEFEAEAALRQAQKLMAKHGIEASELQARTGNKPMNRFSDRCAGCGKPWQQYMTKTTYPHKHPRGGDDWSRPHRERLAFDPEHDAPYFPFHTLRCALRFAQQKAMGG